MKLLVWRPALAAAVIAIGAVLVASVFSTTAQVLTTVDLLVPAATPLTTGLGGDEITFVSGATVTSVAGDCGVGGAVLAQGVVVVQGGAPKLVTAIVMSGLDEIRAGTRLGNLSLNGECTLGTIVYRGYRGFVQ
jgi:hypothetical protein